MSFSRDQAGDQERYCGVTAYLRRGSGRPLVFIHGVGMNKQFWQFQIDAFAPDHDVVAYDILGHGGSVLPPPAPGLGDYADQLEALLDGLGFSTAVIAGHSMGGLIALRFALDHPDRCAGIVVMNSVYGRTEAERAPVRERADQLARFGGEATREATLARWFGDAVPDPRRRQLRQRIDAWLRSADAIGYSRAYTLLVDADRDLEGRLGGIRCPALFMTAENDPNSTPAMARRMAREAPAGQVAIIEGERHMMPMLAPDKVNPVLGAFLDEALA